MHKRTHTGSSYSTHKWHLVKSRSFLFVCLFAMSSIPLVAWGSHQPWEEQRPLTWRATQMRMGGLNSLLLLEENKNKQDDECAPATINPSPYVKPQIIESHAPCRQEQRPQDYVAGVSHGWEQSLQEASMAGAPTPTITEVKWQWRLGGLLWQLVSCGCSTSMMTSHREHG